MVIALKQALVEAAFIGGPFFAILIHQTLSDLQQRRRRADFLRGSLVNKDLLR